MRVARPAAGLPVLFETAGTVIDLAGHRDYDRALCVAAVEAATLAALHDVARDVVCACGSPNADEAPTHWPAHGNAVVEHVVSAVRELPFDDQSFDLALWPTAASSPTDATSELAEIFRVLRPRGVLIAHGTAVALARLTRLVEEYGFSVDTVVAVRCDEGDRPGHGATETTGRPTVTLASTSPSAAFGAASSDGHLLTLSLRAVKWGRVSLPEAVR